MTRPTKNRFASGTADSSILQLVAGVKILTYDHCVIRSIPVSLRKWTYLFVKRVDGTSLKVLNRR